jgi:hypothetical protein
MYRFVVIFCSIMILFFMASIPIELIGWLHILVVVFIAIILSFAIINPRSVFDKKE